MPRIPTSNNQARPAQVVDRGTAKTQDIGKGVSALGQQVSNIGSELRKRQEKAELNSFKNEYNRSEKMFELELEKKMRSGVDEEEIEQDLNDFAKQRDTFIADAQLNDSADQINNYVGNVRSQSDLGFRIKFEKFKYTKNKKKELNSVDMKHQDSLRRALIKGSMSAAEAGDILKDPELELATPEEKESIRRKAVTGIQKVTLEGIRDNGIAGYEEAVRVISSKVEGTTKELYLKQVEEAKEANKVKVSKQNQAYLGDVQSISDADSYKKLGNFEKRSSSLKAFIESNQSLGSGTNVDGAAVQVMQKFVLQDMYSVTQDTKNSMTKGVYNEDKSLTDYGKQVLMRVDDYLDGWGIL